MTFVFSGTMLRFVDYARAVEISEPTLERALAELLAQRPGLRPVLLDGAGNLRRSHQMFLNGESMDPRYYTDRQARAALPTEPADSVYFLTAIAGGEPVPAVASTRYALDTGMFSVHQMHPEAALRLGGSVALGGHRRVGRPRRALGGGSRPFFLGRGDCELADQWLYVRLPSLVGAAREQRLLDGAAGLAATARQPLAGFHGEFHRPLYFGDRGTVEVAAYRAGERTVVAHQVHGAPLPGATRGSRPLCALALEVF